MLHVPGYEHELRQRTDNFHLLEEALREAAGKGPVFSKDFPHYVETVWTDDFLDHFTHSFLIRDPAKTIISMSKHWPDFHPKETGFAEQHALFDRLADRTGAAPPVIDSDDLLENPFGIVEAWSKAVGIPFMPAALRWQPGARDEVSWWDGGSFHENLRNSDGLKPQPRKTIDLTEAPDQVKRCYEEVLPAYEALYKHRITAEVAS